MAEENKLNTINASLTEPEYGFQQNKNGYWCCDLCNHEEVNKDDIRTHRILHFSEHHQCPICQKSFNSSTSLRNHLTVHTGIKKYRCKYCGRKFGWKTQLARHENIHTGKGLHHCSVCSKSFMTKWILQRHMKVHTKHLTNQQEGGGQLQRIAFSEACIDQLDFNQGLEAKEPHNISLNSFKTESSKSETLRPVYLKNIHSSPLKTLVTCFQCNENFLTERMLAFHLLDHNNDAVPQVSSDRQDLMSNENQIGDTNMDENEEFLSNSDQFSKLKSNLNMKSACKGSLTTIVSKLHHKVDELNKNDLDNEPDNNIDVHIVESSDTPFLNITLGEKRDDKDNGKSVMSKTIDPFISGINNPSNNLNVANKMNKISDENNGETVSEITFLRQQIAKQNVVVNTLKRNCEESSYKYCKEIQSLGNKVDLLTNLVNSQSLILNKIVLGGKMTVNGMLDFTVQQPNE